ncbi:MAG: CaiB/BaiF CoA transferase family protein [Candidatus Baltobacteraceae bacterium]
MRRSTSSGGPLTGIRVVEVGNYLAAPFCAAQLADLGADVIKVENPDGGDMSRQAGPFLDGESSGFVRLNRNKRSLGLDLKSERGKELFRKLAAQSDVVIENLRPGTMTHLGLDYEPLSAINPRLVYFSASGWGQDGPYAQRPGLDIMAQAMSGLMSITGEEGGNPVKVGVPITDLACALYGALAIASALYAREQTGRGQHIDVCLFEAGVALSVWEAGKYFATGEIPRRNGSAHQTSAPYQALRSSDGYFTVGATSPKTWTAFCAVLKIEDLRDDPRFALNRSRKENLDELLPLLEAVTTAQPTDHWVTALQAAGVPCERLQTYDQVYNDPQLTGRQFFSDVPHAKLGPIRVMGSPMRFSETKVAMRAAAPVLGEHTAEILSDLGCQPSEVHDLINAGIVAAATVHA